MSPKYELLKDYELRKFAVNNPDIKTMIGQEEYDYLKSAGDHKISIEKRNLYSAWIYGFRAGLSQLAETISSEKKFSFLKNAFALASQTKQQIQQEAEHRNYNTDNNKERFERAGFKVHTGYKASDGNIPINFNAPYDVMAKEIHQFNVNKGWWDAFLPDRKLDRCETALMLVVSELAEAMEGCRKDLMDDKLPEFPMFDVELADAMIRLLDLGGAVGLNLNMLNDVQTELRRRSKPEQLWFIVENLAIAKSNANVQVSIGVGILLIKYLAGFYNIDIRMVMEKKMIFNATREDHLRENRAKDNGKKF